jgi:multidrug efflux pump subunit AcrB
VSSNIITVFSLAPKDAAAAKYDDLFITNYITINVLDEIKRIKGVGDAKIFPAKDYGIRLWLDPERLKARGLTTMDVISALKEQNVQVAAGAIGQPPVPTGQAYQYNVSTLGRLNSVDQFENVIVRAEGNRIIRVKDVARVELGGKSYDLLARVQGHARGDHGRVPGARRQRCAGRVGRGEASRREDGGAARWAEVRDRLRQLGVRAGSGRGGVPHLL